MHLFSPVGCLQAVTLQVHARTVKMIEGSGHDVMLDWKWQECGSEIVAFVKSL